VDLKVELVRLGLTQRAVARDMGIGHTYLSKLINGTGAKWGRRTARSFSMVTGIPLDSFYEGDA
jgi:transcriptional regulator with XRE-family HTH domain